jgi:hypothetical protein
LRRAVLAGGGGALYVDTLNNNRARTVRLVLDLADRKSLEWREGPGFVAVQRTPPEGELEDEDD